MTWVRWAIAAVLENVNGLVVVVGAWWLYFGIASVSRPAADVVAGVLIMAIGAYPYVMRRNRKP